MHRGQCGLLELVGWRGDHAYLILRGEACDHDAPFVDVRRSIAKPTEIAYCLCYGPATARLVDLAWTAGSRWHVEEAFQQAKGEAGLDHYQVRAWRAWYAHITLSMLAPAWLAASKTIAAKGDSPILTKT
ncbi:conserved hypothetical protein [Nocardia seriolae]|nr:conserved hypothetical protein [Nocardia seriolae]